MSFGWFSDTQWQVQVWDGNTAGRERVRRLRVLGWSGQDFSNSCGCVAGLKCAGRERTKISTRARLVSAIPAAYLLCSTAVRQDIRAVWCFRSCELPCRSVDCVPLFLMRSLYFWSWNCVDVALSVFYALFYSVAEYFFQSWTALS